MLLLMIMVTSESLTIDTNDVAFIVYFDAAVVVH